ncbi:MAG: hypothetical protein K5837_02000 [Candidatus Saccharibacteria bacterium]|nr:hypothetical protein [Candidatus Saccharibacteria bacterium]
MGIYFGATFKIKDSENERFAVYYEKSLARLDDSVKGPLFDWRDDLTVVQDSASNLPLITAGRSLPEMTYLVLASVNYGGGRYDQIIVPNDMEVKVCSVVRDRYPYAHESVCDVAILETKKDDLVCIRGAYYGYFLYVITEDDVVYIWKNSSGLLHISALNCSNINSDLYCGYLADGRFNNQYWREINLAAD